MTKKETKEKIQALEKLIGEWEMGIEVAMQKRKYLLIQLTNIDRTVNQLTEQIDTSETEIEELRE